MTFKAGGKKPPGSGRQKGVQNRITRRVREVLEEILNEPESEERLRALRDSDEAADRSTFWRIAQRLVPNEIAAKVDNEIRVRLVDVSDDRSDDEAPPLPPPVIPTTSPDVDLRSAPRDLAPAVEPEQPRPVVKPEPAPIYIARPWEDGGGIQDEADWQ